MTNQAQDLRSVIRQALASQRSRTVTILSSLLAVEEAIGYIPREAIEEVAHATEATVNDVWGVASFYTNFRFTPPARHAVEVCWGPSCHVRGAPDVLRAVLDSLGLPTEGESSDRQVSFRYNTCLGACAQAPVMSMDHRLVGGMTAERALEALRKLLQGEEAGAGR